MKESKEQHYVPKFYLKFFATDDNKKEIAFYNLVNKKFFTHAPIKSQAKVKTLYGDDGVMENWLSGIEATTARILQGSIEREELPDIHSEASLSMLHYILIQHSRTLQRAQELNDQMSQMASRINAKIPSPQVFRNTPIALSEVVEIANDTLPLLAYLSFVLIKNETTVPFITSDVPVVLYNHLMEEKKSPTFGDAWAFKGLQVFFPLSPKLTIHWYDPSVYKIGGKKFREFIRLTRYEDLFSLNSLQYTNCHEQLFFDRDFKEAELNKLINKYHRLRSSIKLPTFETASFTFVAGHDKRMGFRPSFIHLTKYGKDFKLGGRFVHFRHPSFDAIRQATRGRP
jgi:hypothetical protein